MKILLAVFGLVACGKSASDAPKGPRTQVTYSLDAEAAVVDRTDVLRADIAEGLVEQKIAATVRVPLEPIGAVTIVPEDQFKKQEIHDWLMQTYKDAIEWRDCPVSEGPAAMCIRLSASHAASIKKAALGIAVDTIRARLDAVKVASPSVHEKDGMIVVSFPANDEQGAMIRDLIARTGKLELKVVDNNADFMRQIYAQVGAEGSTGDPVDPRAQQLEVRAEIDQWRPDDGGMQVDYYLIAHDREEKLAIDEAKRIGCFGRDAGAGSVMCRVSGRVAIERYLAELAQRDPRYKVPDDRQLGFELVQPYPDARDQRPFWRSYYLERTARLTGRDISNAAGTFDPNTNRPLVLLDFGRAGAQKFAQLTSEIVGKKLATILDGKIKSAPIIMGPIRGGRASITMGGSDPAQQEAERDELVTVLKTGSLPAPLREESITTIDK